MTFCVGKACVLVGPITCVENVELAMSLIEIFYDLTMSEKLNVEVSNIHR